MNKRMKYMMKDVRVIRRDWVVGKPGYQRRQQMGKGVVWGGIGGWVG